MLPVLLKERNMKTAAIIAEYNPFHQGHRYLMEELKTVTDAERIVVLMSGNSVQRGDFAFVDKFARASAAVQGGADLVLELPFCYCSQSAEFFAHGAVSILHYLGLVDYLCYGSENNDMDSQWRIANLLYEESDELTEEIKAIVKTGISFPVARQKALEKLYPNQANFSIMSSPNDILAIEYLKAMYQLDSVIEPISIRRRGAGYKDTKFETELPSATAIRKKVTESATDHPLSEELKAVTTEPMAEYILKRRNEGGLGTVENYFDELKSIIIRQREAIGRIFEIGEGIDHLIRRKIYETSGIHELAMEIKSKRYTYTRARRMLMNILVGLDKEAMSKIRASRDVPYTRILAFNDKGRKMLRECSKQISIINKPADFRPANELHEILQRYDEIAGELYYMKYHYQQYGNRVYSDKMTSPIYIGQGEAWSNL